MTDAKATKQQLKVFISYSRADSAFADQLEDGLDYDGGFEVLIDRHSISEGEDWQKRLGSLIAGCDTVVFVLSPDSAKSKVCAWEVDEAVRLSKRIIPVLWRPLGAEKAPEKLAALNYVRFDDGRTFIAGLRPLARALKADVDWLREHTRQGELAARWLERGRPESLLLRGDTLDVCKAWVARRKPDAPEITDAQRAFFNASEEGESNRLKSERERLDQMAAAQAEREKALQQAQVALRSGQRALAAAGGLFACLIVGAVGWANQAWLKEQYHWRVVMGPSVLTREAERQKAATPGAEFKECAHGCPVMIVVPPGKFVMGSPDGKTPIVGLDGKPKTDSLATEEAGHTDDEGPQHEVAIAKPFAVGKYDVTFAEWDTCIAAVACPKVSDEGWGRGDRPVILVSWEEAKRYVTWLKRMTGQDYRLLTEAEWEYAARAGKATVYSFGDDPKQLADYAWFDDNSDSQTQPVGKKKPNDFGLNDMHGNVDQWVQDCYVGTYESAPTDGTSPPKHAGCRRVVRGGSWVDGPDSLRSARREGNTIGDRADSLGFRVARTLLPPAR